MSSKHFPSWPQYADDEQEAVERVLRSGKVNQWTGDEVNAFASEFAQYHDMPFCVPLTNGTVALELAWKTLGIGVGDEVIVTPRSFIASASSIAICGATPVFVDVDRESQNIDPRHVEGAITRKTKAVLAVHLAGWPCDMPRLRQICKREKLFLVEDCAQSHGAKINGQLVGSWGDLAAFSFCQDKIMTTGGEGGALLMHDRRQFEEAWSYKDHGKNFQRSIQPATSSSFRWLHDRLGTNWRMLEIQAAIGRVQLKKLSHWVEIRRKNALLLQDRCSQTDWLRITTPPAGWYHSYYKYYTFVRPERLPAGWSRDKIITALRDKGVPVLSGSCSEMYLENMWKQTPHRINGVCTVAQELANTSLAFAVHSTLTVSDMNRIGTELQQLFSDRKP